MLDDDSFGASADQAQPLVLVTRLVSIAKAARQLVALKLADAGIMSGQDQFLLCLMDGEAVSIADVADRLSVRSATISKMADVLEIRGWIGREADHRDLRKVRIRLTPEGRRMRETVRTIQAKVEAEVIRDLGHDPRVVPVLAKLDAALAQRLGRLR